MKGFSVYGVVCVLLLVHLPTSQVHGIQIVFDWTSKFLEFVGGILTQNKFAVVGLNNGNPITTPNLIAGKGYPVEVHEITTPDGYILEVHRIPHGSHPRRSEPVSRTPVLVMHGGMAVSADWVINPDIEDCLGFYLADRGYDVWLGNIRGNDYARRHVSLTPSDKRFWAYSQHEVAIYDVASTIDHILNVTGQPKIFYTGVSLGSASLIVLLAKKPEYNKKIGIASLMAPGAVYMDNSLHGAPKLLAPIFLPFVNLALRIFGEPPLIPYFITDLLHRVLPVVCSPNIDWFGVCLKLLALQYGNDQGLITKEKVPLITSIVPSPISLRTLSHGFQPVALGHFSEYDFGTAPNLEIYGTSVPPRYNLNNVQIPISIIVGPNDKHVPIADASKLVQTLPNVIDFYLVRNKFFHHIDFSYATGVGKLVYHRIVHVFDTFNHGGVLDNK